MGAIDAARMGDYNQLARAGARAHTGGKNSPSHGRTHTQLEWVGGKSLRLLNSCTHFGDVEGRAGRVAHIHPLLV